MPTPVDRTNTREGSGAATLPSTPPNLSRTSFNAAVSAGGKAFYLATRFFIPPVVLAHVGLEAYGIWSTCFVLVGYLGMATFGVSNVYIRYAAQFDAQGHPERVAELFATGVAVTSGIGACAMVAAVAGIPTLVGALGVSESFRSTANWLFISTALIFVVDMSLGAATYILHGMQRLAVANGIWVSAVALETVLIVVLLRAGLGVWGLLVALAVRYVFSIAVSVMAARRFVPGLSLRPGLVRREHVHLFFDYGGVVQVSGLLSMFLRSVEKMISGVVLGAPAAGLMDLGEKLPGAAVSVPSAMNAAYLPAATHLHARGDPHEEIVKLYVSGSRSVSLVTGPAMAFLAAFSGPIIAAWLGPREDLVVVVLVMTIFCLPWQMNVITGPASAVFRGIGKPAWELVYPVSQLLLVVVFVPLGFSLAGRSLVVISVTVGGSMIASALVYLWFANKRLNVSQSLFARRVLLPGVLPYPVGAALAFAAWPWTSHALNARWTALAVVVAAAVLYAALMAPVLAFGILDHDEKRAAVRWLARLRALGTRRGRGREAA